MKVYDMKYKRSVRRGGRMRLSKFQNTEQDPIVIESNEKNTTDDPKTTDIETGSDMKSITKTPIESQNEGSDKPQSSEPIGCKKGKEGNNEKGHPIVELTDSTVKQKGKADRKKKGKEDNNEKDKDEGTTTRRSTKRQKTGIPKRNTRSTKRHCSVTKSAKRKRTGEGGDEDRNSKKQRVRSKSKWPNIKARCTPHQLSVCVKKLKKKQRDAVICMGFGKLLKFRVNGIPSKLGHYVVDHLDLERMEIKVEQGGIKVDCESIHRLLGIPRQGLEFDSLIERSKLESTIKKWKDRYPGQIYVAPTDIVCTIANSADDDSFLFKLDFLMLFLATMVESSKNGRCENNVLHSLTGDTNLGGINWCSYIIQTMKKCKRKWDPKDQRSPFVGPLALLILLYVDNVECPGVEVDTEVPAIEFWTQDKLREREYWERKNGGFGKGKLRRLSKGGAKAGASATRGRHKQVMSSEAGGCSKANEENNSAEFLVELSKAEQLYEIVLDYKLKFERRFGEILQREPRNNKVVTLKTTYKAMLKEIPNWPEDEDLGTSPRNLLQMLNACDTGAVISEQVNKEQEHDVGETTVLQTANNTSCLVGGLDAENDEGQGTRGNEDRREKFVEREANGSFDISDHENGSQHATGNGDRRPNDTTRNENMEQADNTVAGRADSGNEGVDEEGNQDEGEDGEDNNEEQGKDQTEEEGNDEEENTEDDGDEEDDEEGDDEENRGEGEDPYVEDRGGRGHDEDGGDNPQPGGEGEQYNEEDTLFREMDAAAAEVMQRPALNELDNIAGGTVEEAANNDMDSWVGLDTIDTGLWLEPDEENKTEKNSEVEANTEQTLDTCEPLDSKEVQNETPVQSPGETNIEPTLAYGGDVNKDALGKAIAISSPDIQEATWGGEVARTLNVGGSNTEALEQQTPNPTPNDEWGPSFSLRITQESETQEERQSGTGDQNLAGGEKDNRIVVVGDTLIKEGDHGKPCDKQLGGPARQPSTRVRSRSRFTKSPYMVREVEIERSYTKLEDDIWSYVFPTAKKERNVKETGETVKQITARLRKGKTGNESNKNKCVGEVSKQKINDKAKPPTTTTRKPRGGSISRDPPVGILYETLKGVQLYAEQMQTLHPDMVVANVVIDAWAEVLNYYEQWRADESPRRLFCGTQVILDWMLTKQTEFNADDGARATTFTAHMFKELYSTKETHLGLKAFDLVFIPVVENEHIYLMVFDLKYPGICLIDNLDERISPVKLKDSTDYYEKSTPYKVKQMFVHYLEMWVHPRVGELRASDIERLHLEHTTTENGVDAAVYVMRHMEMFMGKNEPFKCGFARSEYKRAGQIGILRKKFAAKLVLAEDNVYKGCIVAAAST